MLQNNLEFELHEYFLYLTLPTCWTLLSSKFLAISLVDMFTNWIICSKQSLSIQMNFCNLMRAFVTWQVRSTHINVFILIQLVTSRQEWLTRTQVSFLDETAVFIKFNRIVLFSFRNKVVITHRWLANLISLYYEYLLYGNFARLNSSFQINPKFDIVKYVSC